MMNWQFKRKKVAMAKYDYINKPEYKKQVQTIKGVSPTQAEEMHEKKMEIRKKEGIDEQECEAAERRKEQELNK